MQLALPCTSWVEGCQLDEFWNGQEISYNQLLCLLISKVKKVYMYIMTSGGSVMKINNYVMDRETLSHCFHC